MSICKRSGIVSIHCYDCFSHKGAGVHHINGHLDDLHYHQILQNVMLPSELKLYPDSIIHLQENHSSMILVWFDNGFIYRPPTNSLTGHRERLKWTVSRICGVRWKRQCRKHGLSSLPETAMDYGLLCHTRGMKLLRLRVTFHQWLRPWPNEWNHRLKQKDSELFMKRQFLKTPCKD